MSSQTFYFLDGQRMYFTEVSDPNKWKLISVSMSHLEYGFGWEVRNWSRSNRARLRKLDAWRTEGIKPTALRVIRP